MRAKAIIVAVVMALAVLISMGSAVLAAPDPPNTAIDSIPDYVNSLTQITGTATDDVAIAGVEVQINCVNTARYWNGISWTSTATWLNAQPADGSWGESSEDWMISSTTTPALPAWVDGMTYNVYARADDGVEKDPTPHTETFIYDTTAPATTITDIPASVLELTEVTGTATDTSPGKVAGVEAQIRRDSDDKYWNGISWTSTATWLNAQPTDGTWNEISEEWKITATTSPKLPTSWGEGVTYSIRARATDKAGNVGSYDTESFAYDVTEPDTTITDIDTYVNSLSEITGTATDDVEVGEVEVLIQRDSDNKYWNGTSWQTSEKWIDATASDGAFDETGEDWKITSTTSPALPEWADGLTYNIEARAVDAAGNVDPSPATESFTYDVTAPATTITDIPASVRELTKIRGTATDDVEVGGVEVLIQRDSDNKYWNGASWQTSAIWIDATASDGAFDETSEGWEVTTVTSPALPAWEAGKTYSIQARAVDAAGNVDSFPAAVDVTIQQNGGLAWWHILLIGLGGLAIVVLVAWTTLRRFRKWQTTRV